MNAERRRLLAVEDDNVAARILRTVAADLDLGFVRAGSARLASMIFRPGSFALAVVDLGLPEDEGPGSGDADGFDVVRRMLDLEPNLPAVVWTASLDLRKNARACALGVRVVDKAGGFDEIHAARRLALGR